MRPEHIERLLRAVQEGTQTVDAALAELRSLPFEAHADLTLDHHRELRTGLVEAVLASHKTADQVARALSGIAARNQPALATRVSPEQANAVRLALPEAHHDPIARTLTIGALPSMPDRGTVAIVAGGSSDASVAREAEVTLATYGVATLRIDDVGVAGIHRVLARRAELEAARVVIVVAGMEGALPSVVGGLVGAPVIAVPTSVGYGVSSGGFAALFGMLGSCASGVAVVNIDNGYGAACAALRILHNRVRS